ncbi:VOC family protein [Actinomadura sp. WMMB 499]|uniref:VOC family protein n=1 Tax=Actinomadura sp. WMMB 499 TaxID=1219491 RepID=UPI0012469AF9|nr:VOC family protein [Actinomadura sp. WMMB 499]QFG25008.1 VOC family protein [Actinomadura sp. WMMB 499]
MKAEDQFHVGVVVDDVEAALAEYAVLGHRWTAELGGPTPVRTSSGETVLNLRCVYSTTTPRMEIVGRVPGTLWEPAASGVHHVGYWSDDVAADRAELESHGYVLEAERVGPDGVPSFAFCRSPAGLLVELVSRASQPGLESCWGESL